MQENFVYSIQISGKTPDNKSILSVLASRSYTLRNKGKVTFSGFQRPLTLDFKFAENNNELLVDDLDLFPFKFFTDLIVKGNAYPLHNKTKFSAITQVSKFKKEVLVIGDRQVALTNNGKIIFSEPNKIEFIPLRYDYAFGGIDEIAEQNHPNYFEEFYHLLPGFAKDIHFSLFAYPRNTIGKGYLVEKNKAAIDKLKLPNLEDHSQLITPGTLITGDVKNWPKMPIPQAFDWINPEWFPRVAYFGVLPEYDSSIKRIPEIIKGYVPNNIMENKPVQEKFNLRCSNGASLGLQLPYLKGNETIRLTKIHPKHSEFVFRLPGERPKIWVDGRNGKLKSTNPVIHTIVIEPEENRLSIVWRGSAPALRPYLEQELKTMPFKVQW